MPTSAPYATRGKVKQSYAIDVFRNIEDLFFPLYSAFSVIQERPRLHRDQLPSPPRTYAEFLSHPYQRGFRRAMDIEYHTLETNGTFKKVQKTNDITVISTNKWVWIYKFDEKGHLLKFKARIVAYASTLALKTFRILLAIICHFDWISHSNGDHETTRLC
jgi:hypothetical protein